MPEKCRFDVAAKAVAAAELAASAVPLRALLDFGEEGACDVGGIGFGGMKYDGNAVVD